MKRQKIEPLKWDGDRLDIARIDDTTRACYLKIQMSINALRDSVIKLTDAWNTEQPSQECPECKAIKELADTYDEFGEIYDPEYTLPDLADRIANIIAELLPKGTGKKPMEECSNCKGHGDMNWQVELSFHPKVICPVCNGTGKA